MSTSLQYSNYAGQVDFAVPYEILTAPKAIQEMYLESCKSDMDCYKELCAAGIGHDAAGYATPQGLRNVLIIDATPYQWKHIIGQRVCRRNTDETRIVLLKIWQELFSLSPVLFAPDLTGPFCQRDKCLEGKMSCGRKIAGSMMPGEILAAVRKKFTFHFEERQHGFAPPDKRRLILGQNKDYRRYRDWTLSGHYRVQ